jgi:hypothetical protein
MKKRSKRTDFRNFLKSGQEYPYLRPVLREQNRSVLHHHAPLQGIVFQAASFLHCLFNPGMV